MANINFTQNVSVIRQANKMQMVGATYIESKSLCVVFVNLPVTLELTLHANKF